MSVKLMLRERWMTAICLAVLKTAFWRAVIADEWHAAG
ncbi:hypothetical protein ABIE41_001050 [Bosea sp. OAE506]